MKKSLRAAFKKSLQTNSHKPSTRKRDY